MIDDPQRTYMEGWCHVFAVAVLRIEKAGLVLFADQRDMFGEIPAVRHVMARTTGGALVDIRGAHDADAEIDAWEGTPGQVAVEISCEQDLLDYVGDGDSRPLTAYGEEAVLRATGFAMLVLLKNDQGSGLSPFSI